MTGDSTIEHMLLDVDEREVDIDRLGRYRMLVQFDSSTGKVYLRWAPIDVYDLGPLIDIKPERVKDALAHPMLYDQSLRALYR